MTPNDYSNTNSEKRNVNEDYTSKWRIWLLCWECLIMTDISISGVGRLKICHFTEGARGFTTIRHLRGTHIFLYSQSVWREAGIVPLDCLHATVTADSSVLDWSDLLFVMQICLDRASTNILAIRTSRVWDHLDLVDANRLSHVTYLELKIKKKNWNDRILKNERDFRTHDSQRSIHEFGTIALLRTSLWRKF